VLISGQPLKQSMQTGMSLSQNWGVFFLLSQLGMTMNVTSSFFISGSSSGLSRDDFHAFYGEAGYSVLRISRKILPRKWTAVERYQFECKQLSC
jgi:CPA2 family monovalent cation:H+ antiporter-2